MPKTQANTFLSLNTPLGPDTLLLERLTGAEGVSQLFHFELELLSEDHELAFDKLVGQAVTVSIDLFGAAEPRYLHGHISSLQQLRGKGELACYRAELVPWLWFLTQTADCRIFQNKRVHEIIEQVCHDNGHRDIKNSLAGDYAKLDYCVQYRESDFAFMSRLMEHFGISYYFEHHKDKHLLVLVDAAAKQPDCPGQKKARYKGDDRVVDLQADPGVVTDLQVRQQARPGKYTYRDYNFERPQQSLEVGIKGKVRGTHAAYEVYDYPGKYLNRDQGEAVTKVRMQELEAQQLRVSGTSTCRPFVAGHAFELTEHPRGDLNNKYLLLEVTHRACAGGYLDQPASYQNEFSCIPVKGEQALALRPARRTPWPRVEGPQTAVVVGDAGEEIHTDKHGRIKIQFHWDREGKRDADSSCWVRVSQGWAGKGFGAMFLPRIGQEVIVDFLEGNPDQPIVTGAVYNGQQTPPYPLPGERSKSTIKTSSYKGDGSNELRFEDKGGSEEVYLHAQKDLNEVVGNDQTIKVSHDQTTEVTNDQKTQVGHDQATEVANDQTTQVGHDQTVTISNNQTTNVSGSMTVHIDKTLTEVVAINYSETVGAAMELTVGAAYLETVGALKQVSVGAALNETIALSHTEEVGGSLSVMAGKGIKLQAGKEIAGKAAKEISLNAGTKVTIVAVDEITLKAGSASIVLSKNGNITIKGKEIQVKGDGAVTIKGSKVALNP